MFSTATPEEAAKYLPTLAARYGITQHRMMARSMIRKVISSAIL